MAVLVVSEEERNHATLRAALEAWGAKPIYCVRSGAEGVELLKREGERVRFIFCDLEVPQLDCIYLLRHVEADPKLDGCAFSGMSSDLSGTSYRAIRERHRRIDGWLFKPFGSKDLHRALTLATRARAVIRDVVLVFAHHRSSIEELIQSALEGGSNAHHFKRALFASTRVELEEALSLHSERIGALLIEPEAHSDGKSHDWLSSFAKRQLGKRMAIGCLSREPDRIGELRKHAQLFFELPRTVDHARALLASLSNRLCNGRIVEFAMNRVKPAMQAKAFTHARAIAEEILRVDRRSPEALALAAEVALLEGRLESAIRDARVALELNPCSSRGNTVLLRASLAAKQPSTAEHALAAARYCPRNIDVLLVAGSVLVQVGQLDRARELARQITEIDPRHLGAKELVHAAGHAG